MTTKDAEIVFSQAEPSHIDSLTTILARSFFPVNEYVKKALPDTPSMRKWWAQVYDEEIKNPACYLLIALDSSTDTVVGVLPLRLIGPDGPRGGFWTCHTWTEDHSEEMWRPPVNCQAYYEQELMQGRPYFLLEMMAVDHAYKGQGIGRRLVTDACKIADEIGHPILVQSGSAKGFYLGLDLGFRTEAEPDWDGYKPAIMVRQVPSR